MHIVKRNSAQGSFNVKRKNGGGVHRLMNMKREGQGLEKDFYEKVNVSHPYESLNRKTIKGLDRVSIKTNKPKKYISLNI